MQGWAGVCSLLRGMGGCFSTRTLWLGTHEPGAPGPPLLGSSALPRPQKSTSLIPSNSSSSWQGTVLHWQSQGCTARLAKAQLRVRFWPHPPGIALHAPLPSGVPGVLQVHPDDTFHLELLRYNLEPPSTCSGTLEGHFQQLLLKLGHSVCPGQVCILPPARTPVSQGFLQPLVSLIKEGQVCDGAASHTA